MLFRWEKDVMKKKFNQINKEIILNYVVKNTSSSNWIIFLLIMVYECCIVNCRSSYTGQEGTTVRRRPNERIDKIR